MNAFHKSFCVLSLVGVLTGCGGTTGGSGQIPSRIDVIATAPPHGDSHDIDQLYSFFGGKPAFLSFIDTSHWSLQVVGESAVDLSTSAFAHAKLVSLENQAVVGTYDSGTFVYKKTASGWVATTFPGISSPLPDELDLVMVGQTATGYAEVDLATNTSTPITLPANSALYYLRHHWLIYGNGTTSFFVRNLTTGEERQLNPIPGDTNFFPYGVNANGGAIGNSGDGTNGRGIYWQPGSSTPTVIDSMPGATIEPGWLSSDGTKFILNSLTFPTSQAYVYVNGTRYSKTDIQNADTIDYLFGFDDQAQYGFAQVNTGSGDSTVAVKITYK